MQCSCGRRMKCSDSRPTDGAGTRRRYRCVCGGRLTTLEVVAETMSDCRLSLGELRGNAVLQEIADICLKAIKENEIS